MEIFETISSAGARSIFDFTDPGKNTRLYTVEVGPDGGVSTDVLDDLAYGDVATAPGYYRLVSNLADMAPAFGEMLTHNYSRELVYPRGKVPIVTVSVQG